LAGSNQELGESQQPGKAQALLDERGKEGKHGSLNMYSYTFI